MTAPRLERSLLRQPSHGSWGRPTLPNGPGRAYVRRQTLRPRLHARLRAREAASAGSSLGVRSGRCDLSGRGLEPSDVLEALLRPEVRVR